MPIDSDLQAAGRRAAAHQVPTAPPITVIEAGAAKHTSRRRMIMSSAAVVVLMAVAFPLALTMRGSTTVQTVAVATGQAAAAQAQADPVAAQQGQGDDDADTAAEDGLRIQLRSGDDVSLSIQVLSGEQAVAAAAVAAANASETLDVDGMDVWVSGTGNERTVSALVEPEEFIEVTGSADEVDMLIDVLRDGGLSHRGDRHGLSALDDAEWQEFFAQFEDGDFNFSFDADGTDFDIDIDELLRDFDAEFEGLDELFGPDGELFFEGFDDFFGPDGEFNFDRDGFVFDGDFSDFFGPDGEFNFDSDAFGAEFDGCIVIDGSDDDNGDAFNLEFPEGCSSTD